MRCATAAIQALAMHPRYADEVMEEAMAMAEALFRKILDCTFIANMPAENARAILEPGIPRLIKTQKPSGMWKIKDCRRISYWVLKALKHSEHLMPLLRENRFRHDPFQSFCDGDDYYDFLVRRNIMEAPLPNDASLQERLASEIFAGQNESGHWNDTVISTSNQIEKLMELGIGHDDKRVKKGADWLFSMCETDVRRLSKRVSGGIVAHDMFSAQDRMAEFRSALAEKAEWNPVGACYRHLPMIQTGAALRALVRLGYEADARVIAACDNLLELRETYGGWCDSNIRTGLIAGQKAGKL